MTNWENIPLHAKEIDLINSPPHYTQGKAKCSACGHSIECIDVVRNLPYAIANAIKYLWRYRDKNGSQDLKKAIWYINDEIKLQIEREQATTEN